MGILRLFQGNEHHSVSKDNVMNFPSTPSFDNSFIVSILLLHWLFQYFVIKTCFALGQLKGPSPSPKLVSLRFAKKNLGSKAET